MPQEQERPPLLARAEVVIGNAMPVVGVIFLGWKVVSVVFLYVLDGWFCVLGLGASIMIQMRDEMRAMIPKTYGPGRRLLFWVAVVGGVEVGVSAFALVPGFAVLAHLDRSPGDALAQVFSDVGVLVPVATLVASHVVRIARGVRDRGEGIEALPPKLRMALFAYRMFLMMFLAGFASPGFLSRFLVPVYVAFVGALFTYSDLYPRRFLARLMRTREDKLDEEEGVAEGDGPARPSLPK